MSFPNDIPKPAWQYTPVIPVLRRRGLKKKTELKFILGYIVKGIE